MLCTQFLVAPKFCENSLELAKLGELDYFLAGIGSYEAAFFLSTMVDSAASLCNQQLSVTGRLVLLCRHGSNASAFKCILHTFWKYLHLSFSNEKYLHSKKFKYFQIQFLQLQLY